MSPTQLVDLIRSVVRDLNEATNKTNAECVQPLRDAGIVADMHVGVPAQDVQFIRGEVLQTMKLEWYAGQLLGIIDDGENPDFIQMWMDQAEIIISDVLNTQG